MSRLKCLVWVSLLAVFSPCYSQVVFDPDYDSEPWAEIALKLPEYPQDGNLYDFYVSPTTTNRFFVDDRSISVGSDGVVRYTLVVLSESGARNVTFEGMRCETRERRIYAIGRSDQTWSEARNSAWVKIREAVTNRQHAALFTDYFCPDGVLSYNVEDIHRALRKGKRL